MKKLNSSSISEGFEKQCESYKFNNIRVIFLQIVLEIAISCFFFRSCFSSSNFKQILNPSNPLFPALSYLLPHSSPLNLPKISKPSRTLLIPSKTPLPRTSHPLNQQPNPCHNFLASSSLACGKTRLKANRSRCPYFHPHDIKIINSRKKCVNVSTRTR